MRVQPSPVGGQVPEISAVRSPVGKRLLAFLLAFLTVLPLLAQKKDGGKDEDKDSLVLLLSAKSARLVEEEGEHYRKVFGPARFLHNGTYLICDTALWNLDRNYIKALGNVKILQDETVLTSDKLDYLIDDDLAQFRGTLVQLTDKEGNLLRTRFLDFNTRDSVAVFSNGGSMKDKDGQVIESIDGTYDARIKLFTFLNDVNMFTDSVFVKTEHLLYDGKTSFATFMTDLNAWRDDNMLSAGGGWYDRPKDLFFFERNVHGLTPTQEAWSDSLYFDRLDMTVDMFGNAQVSDTTRNAIGLAGHITYRDTLSEVTLTRTPMVIAISEEDDGRRDSTWIGGERLVYYTVPMCDIDSLYKIQSATRREEILVDAVTEYRHKAAEAAEKARQEAQRRKDEEEGKIAPQTGEKPGAKPAAKPTAPPKGDAPEDRATPPPPPDRDDAPPMPPRDSLGQTIPPRDSSLVIPSEVEESAPRDSSLVIPSDPTLVIPSEVEESAPIDSLTAPLPPPAPVDSTRIGFFFGKRNVKIYRQDFQVVCDSLAYTDLDSLARLYQRPFIWNEPNRQFSADSVAALIQNNRMDRVSLMSDAFVAIQEDSLLYDQIRGTEMMAFFDEEGAMNRFDALGGSSALFYLEENGTLATVNTVEAKMLSTRFKEGQLDHILYFEDVKNDAFPVVQLPPDKRHLKGFEWRGDIKPNGPKDISEREVRASERKEYESFPHAAFRQTDIYFPGYMAGVHKTLAENEHKRELRRAERRSRQALADSLARAAAADSLSLPPIDSLALPPVDSLVISSDSTFVISSDSTLVISSDSPFVISSEVEKSDSLSVTPSDSTLVISSDSTLVISSAVEKSPTPAELKAAQKAAEKARRQAEKERKAAERAAKKAARQAAREAHWAELDRRDAEKAAAKEARRQERLLKKNERVQAKIRADEERERQVFEKYKARYEKQKAREDARQQQQR